jgi:hypothetical protein
MPYNFTTSDGSITFAIPDGQFDESTSLTLPGPNATGYGQFLNQNLVKLLDSFASNTAPSGTSLQGQLWFNKSTKILNVFTGDQGYLPVSGLIIASSQPATASIGNTWFNTTTNQYFFYDGTTWNLIGPSYTKSQGIAGAFGATVTDSTSANHNIIEIQNGPTVLATISGDAAFIPSPTLLGFPTINPGITLNNSIAGSAFSGNLSGTVLTANQPYITKVGTLTNLAVTGTATINGATILTSSGSFTTSSINNTPIGNVTPSTGTFTNLTVTNSIVPSSNATVNIGSSSAWFNNIYGTATHAQYADLAEKYLADASYTPGTVLMFGGEHEVTVAAEGTTAIAGVVSTNPAHLMNGLLDDINAVAIALVGRVPCNVIGPVNKGDLLVSAGNGYAQSSADPKLGQVIGRALNSSTAPAGQIEIVVGRVC